MFGYGDLVSVVLISLAFQSISVGFRLNPHRRKPAQKQEVVGESAESSLVLTHVLFRHGNRTPETSEQYPNDPYLNYTFFPYKKGQLTNAGKIREYSIGTALRRRYDGFLGEYYFPDLVYARSTDRNRTKMSLLLVLASLFPPKCEEDWQPGLNWQPVPYNYVPTSEDPLLYGIACPTYEKLYNEMQHSPEAIAEYSQYSDTFRYISENSGLNVTTVEDVYNLNFGLTTEHEFGLELPEWTRKVWPQEIDYISEQQYYYYCKTTTLKKMAAGYLLQKIIQDSEDRINEVNNDTKIYLYSAHENNIGQMLVTLNIYEYLHIPNYGSYILFELHYINNSYGLKIFYQNYNGTTNPKLMKLPGCDEFCPLNEFKTLVEEYLPEPGLCGN